MGALKDFLGAERESVESMTAEQLAVELQGYRALVSMLPQEVIEWVIRLGEPFRLVTRRYEPKTGVLVHVKLEATEYTLEIIEPSFDSVRGVRLLERKVICMPKEAVLYHEDVTETQDYQEWIEEQKLAEQSLDLEVGTNA